MVFTNLKEREIKKYTPSPVSSFHRNNFVEVRIRPINNSDQSPYSFRWCCLSFMKKRAKYINFTKPPVHKEGSWRRSLRPHDSLATLFNEVMNRAVTGHVGAPLVSPHLPFSQEHFFKVYEVRIARLPAREYTLTQTECLLKTDYPITLRSSPKAFWCPFRLSDYQAACWQLTCVLAFSILCPYHWTLSHSGCFEFKSLYFAWSVFI